MMAGKSHSAGGQVPCPHAPIVMKLPKRVVKSAGPRGHGNVTVPMYPGRAFCLARTSSCPARSTPPPPVTAPTYCTGHGRSRYGSSSFTRPSFVPCCIHPKQLSTVRSRVPLRRHLFQGMCEEDAAGKSARQCPSLWVGGARAEVQHRPTPRDPSKDRSAWGITTDRIAFISRVTHTHAWTDFPPEFATCRCCYITQTHPQDCMLAIQSLL